MCMVNARFGVQWKKIFTDGVQVQPYLGLATAANYPVEKGLGFLTYAHGQFICRVGQRSYARENARDYAHAAAVVVVVVV